MHPRISSLCDSWAIVVIHWLTSGHFALAHVQSLLRYIGLLGKANATKLAIDKLQEMYMHQGLIKSSAATAVWQKNIKTSEIPVFIKVSNKIKSPTIGSASNELADYFAHERIFGWGEPHACGCGLDQPRVQDASCTWQALECQVNLRNAQRWACDIGHTENTVVA